MKEKSITSLNRISDLGEFVNEASKVEGAVTVRKGVYCVDGKSIMGMVSIDVSTGFTVEYPEEAVAFENFISQFE